LKHERAGLVSTPKLDEYALTRNHNNRYEKTATNRDDAQTREKLRRDKKALILKVDLSDRQLTEFPAKP
jgi:hypothetical protein